MSIHKREKMNKRQWLNGCLYSFLIGMGSVLIEGVYLDNKKEGLLSVITKLEGLANKKLG